MDLRNKVPMHIMLNSHVYDEHVYRTLFSKLSHLHKLDADAMPYYESAFTNRYRVYAPLQQSHTLLQFLDPATANEIGSSYSGLDFELQDDELLVYLPAQIITKRDIDHIIKAALWLSEQIDTPPSY